MMRGIILFSFIIFFTACKLSPKLVVSEKDTFYKMFGGALDEKAYDVQETNDGGFLIAGAINTNVIDKTTGNEVEKEVAYLVRTDRFGNLQWQRQYPSKAIRALVKSPSGGWYLGTDSIITIGNTNYLNFALFKINETGNIEWVRKYANSPRQEQLKSLMLDADKGVLYLAGDFRPELLSDDIRMLLITTDLQGNFISSADFGTAGVADNSSKDGPNDVGNVIIDVHTLDKNLLFCGTTRFQGDRGREIRVIPLRADLLQSIGDYNNLFGSLGDDRGEQVVVTRDKNAAVVGTVSGIGAGGRDMYVAKINVKRFSDNGNWENANLEWEKTFGGGGDDEGKSIFQTDDGGYLLLGNIQTTGNGSDIYLAKLDFLGNLQWEKQFGGTRNDQARLVKQLSNGDILILGTITFENNTMIALIRTDRNGNLIK